MMYTIQSLAYSMLLWNSQLIFAYVFVWSGNILTNRSSGVVPPHRRRRQDQMCRVSKAIQLFFRQGRKKLRVVGLECTNFHGRFLSSQTRIRFTMKHSPSEELQECFFGWESLRFRATVSHSHSHAVSCLVLHCLGNKDRSAANMTGLNFSKSMLCRNVRQTVMKDYFLRFLRDTSFMLSNYRFDLLFTQGASRYTRTDRFV